MKSKNNNPGTVRVFAALTLFLTSFSQVMLESKASEAVSIPSANAAGTPRPETASDFGYDVFEGKTNMISRIYKVTPSYVWVFYEGGQSGRKIPRNDLPPQLALKYPYDPDKAREYTAASADDARSQQDQQRAVAYQSLLRREAELRRQIESKSDEEVQVQKEIKTWRRKPKQPGRAVSLTQLLDKKAALSKHISSLNQELQKVRSAQATYR